MRDRRVVEFYGTTIFSDEGRALRAKVDRAVEAGAKVKMDEAEVNLFVRIVCETQRRDRAIIALGDRLAEAADDFLLGFDDGASTSLGKALDAYWRDR